MNAARGDKITLMLVGLGLDSGDLSIRALRALKTASRIYFERYTSIVSKEYLELIKSATGKAEIDELSRDGLEEGAKDLAIASVGENIAILVPGDPLIATTHHIILSDAARLGARIEIYHSASIFTALIGESGLDIYKFGPTTTIPFWRDNYKPISFIDVINANAGRGIHTIVLMDYDYMIGSTIGPKEAAGRLLHAENERKYDIFDGRELIAAFDIGKPSQEIIVSSIGEIAEMGAEGVKGRMLTIIIPGDMSFAEKELVSRFRPKRA